jgi:hypothetical protein
MIVSVRPELATSMYLLGRDASWTNFGAYQPADTAVLAGGAALAGGLTFLKFLAKPGIALHNGTFGSGAALGFAGAEAALALILTPLVILLQQVHPLVAAAFLLVLVAATIAMLVVSLRWLKQTGHEAGRVFTLLQEHPSIGLRVLAEVLLPGSGWLMFGYLARGAVTLVLSIAVIVCALTIIGLLLAIPAYIMLARWSTRDLYRTVRGRLVSGITPADPSVVAI